MTDSSWDEMTDALFDAARKNNVALVKELIGRGVDVNGADGNGWTALYWAVYGGFVECSKVLLEANAHVDKAASNGSTPLHIASSRGHAECVKVWWCDMFSFCRKTISHFRCAAPHRLEGQREYQNKRQSMVSTALGCPLSMR